MWCFGVGISMDNTTVTEGPLREILHGPVLGKAPTTVEDAIVVIPGSDASHFQKLSGEASEKCKNLRTELQKNLFVPFQRGPTSYLGMPT